MTTSILNSHYGWYDVIDPGGFAIETPPAEGTIPPPVGGANGLVGMTYPWRATVATGTRWGPVQVTTEVLTERPHDVAAGYSEIVEVDFTALSDQLTIVDGFVCLAGVVMIAAEVSDFRSWKDRMAEDERSLWW
jgi:hypothetical protein